MHQIVGFDFLLFKKSALIPWNQINLKEKMSLAESESLGD
jgi:hypothetical protein